MLVMLALRPRSAFHWPRELRLMLLMPVCTPVSDIHLPQLGSVSGIFWPRELWLMLMMPIFTKAQLADAHDPGFESAESHFLSREVC